MVRENQSRRDPICYLAPKLQFFRMSTTYLALLRGINLGPKNKISMPDLAEVFTKAGCKGVRTYIQSGNVIFEATPEVSTRLPELIAKEIQRRFGHKVPVMLRTTGEMREVVRKNPFLKEGAAEDILHVMFLTDLPKPGAAKSLDPDRSPATCGTLERIIHGRRCTLQIANSGFSLSSGR